MLFYPRCCTHYPCSAPFFFFHVQVHTYLLFSFSPSLFHFFFVLLLFFYLVFSFHLFSFLYSTYLPNFFLPCIFFPPQFFPSVLYLLFSFYKWVWPKHCSIFFSGENPVVSHLSGHLQLSVMSLGALTT